MTNWKIKFSVVFSLIVMLSFSSQVKATSLDHVHPVRNSNSFTDKPFLNTYVWKSAQGNYKSSENWLFRHDGTFWTVTCISDNGVNTVGQPVQLGEWTFNAQTHILSIAFTGALQHDNGTQMIGDHLVYISEDKNILYTVHQNPVIYIQSGAWIIGIIVEIFFRIGFAEFPCGIINLYFNTPDFSIGIVWY